MKLKYKITKGMLVDTINNNKITLSKLEMKNKIKVATKMLDSLVDCENCIDCADCENCNNSIECMNCVDVDNSEYCMNINNAVFCSFLSNTNDKMLNL